MVRGDDAIGDADSELLDAASLLAGVGILASRSAEGIQGVCSNDMDMEQPDAQLLTLQQRGGPRFVTTLVLTGETVDQRTFMK